MTASSRRSIRVALTIALISLVLHGTSPAVTIGTEDRFNDSTRQAGRDVRYAAIGIILGSPDDAAADAPFYDMANCSNYGVLFSDGFFKGLDIIVEETGGRLPSQ